MTGEVGKYKLAYIDVNEPDVLESNMFDTLKQLNQYQRDHEISDFFVMENIGNNGNGHYKWRMMNRGLYMYYRLGFFFRKYWFEMVLVLVALCIAWYYKRQRSR